MINSTSAVELAAQCDAAVVICGRLAGEAMDVDSLRLPGRQQGSPPRISAANPRTTLVTLGAGPVVLPRETPLRRCCTPGSQASSSRPLSRTSSPAGPNPADGCPFTFPADEQSTPIQDSAQYPGDGDTVQYSEELLVGYRWYDATNLRPPLVSATASATPPLPSNNRSSTRPTQACR